MKRAGYLSAGLLAGVLMAGMNMNVMASEYTDTLQASLEELTSVNRGAGLSGEQEQIEKLTGRMESYGYQITLDEFDGKTRMGETYTSKNMIAKKTADQGEEADILVISAHIDSIPSTVGANDDGSGVAVLESVAKAVADLPSDTELWFVVFSGEEDGLLGSDHFTSQLTDEEKSRMIGDIQLDMLGNRFSEGYEVNTTNGYTNDTAELMTESVKEITGTAVEITQEKSSDHVSFTIAGVPSILFTQHGDGYENHEILDDLSVIDMDKLDESAQITGTAVKKVMSEDTKDLAEQAHGDGLEKTLTGYMSMYDEALDIDISFHGMEDNLGTAFNLIDESEDPDVGGVVQTYECKIYWLNMDQPLVCRPKFYEGQLTYIEVDLDASGYTPEEMQGILKEQVGEPVADKTDEGKDNYFWGWLKARTGFQMTMNDDGSCRFVITPYSEGDVLQSEIVMDENGEPTEAMDETTQKLWDDIISKVVRQEERAAYVDKIELFTDGVHYVMGFTDPAEPGLEHNTMWLDVNDLLNEDGTYRHYYKSVATVIHEFGHALGMNVDQLDVAANGDDAITLPPYKEDSYMYAFMTQFYSDQDVNDSHANENHDFRQHPEDYVSLYASDKTMEDFAESFMCFVLADKQEGSTIAQQKINFFYDYPEMVELRDWIRGNFDWLS